MKHLTPALPLLAGCATNPSTGGSSVVVSSQGREATVGGEMHEEMVAGGAVYDDPELQAYINRVGQRLVKNSDKPDMTFTFTIIDSPDINAFALPGGYIYINRGLLAYLDNEAELAGVLGHEIGHVTARHTARRETRMERDRAASVGVGLLTGSLSAAIMTDLLGKVGQQAYSRGQEAESDKLGLKSITRAGYDPYAQADFLERLDASLEGSEIRRTSFKLMPYRLRVSFADDSRRGDIDFTFDGSKTWTAAQEVGGQGASGGLYSEIQRSMNRWKN